MDIQISHIEPFDAFRGFFEFNQKYYVADLRIVDLPFEDKHIEFIIFPATKTGKIKSYNHKYMSFPSSVNEQTLTEQIEEFCKQQGE